MNKKKGGADKGQKKEEASISDLVKKVASLGLTGAFMTEDAVRGLIQDLPLPKALMGNFLEQIKDQKDDLINSFKSEIKKRLSKIDPTREIDKILDKYEIKMDAKFSFHRKKED